MRFCINTVLPPVEEATNMPLNGSDGIISYFEFLYVYSGMSIGLTIGNAIIHYKYIEDFIF